MLCSAFEATDSDLFCFPDTGDSKRDNSMTTKNRFELDFAQLYKIGRVQTAW